MIRIERPDVIVDLRLRGRSGLPHTAAIVADAVAKAAKRQSFLSTLFSLRNGRELLGGLLGWRGEGACGSLVAQDGRVIFDNADALLDGRFVGTATEIPRAIP